MKTVIDSAKFYMSGIAYPDQWAPGFFMEDIQSLDAPIYVARGSVCSTHTTFIGDEPAMWANTGVLIPGRYGYAEV